MCDDVELATSLRFPDAPGDGVTFHNIPLLQAKEKGDAAEIATAEHALKWWESKISDALTEAENAKKTAMAKMSDAKEVTEDVDAEVDKAKADYEAAKATATQTAQTHLAALQEVLDKVKAARDIRDAKVLVAREKAKVAEEATIAATKRDEQAKFELAVVQHQVLQAEETASFHLFLGMASLDELAPALGSGDASKAKIKSKTAAEANKGLKGMEGLAVTIAKASEEAKETVKAREGFAAEVHQEVQDNYAQQEQRRKDREAAEEDERVRNEAFKKYYDTVHREAVQAGHYDKSGAWVGGTDVEAIETAKAALDSAEIKLAASMVVAAESEMKAQAAWWRAVGKDDAAEELEKYHKARKKADEAALEAKAAAPAIENATAPAAADDKADAINKAAAPFQYQKKMATVLTSQQPAFTVWRPELAAGQVFFGDASSAGDAKAAYAMIASDDATLKAPESYEKVGAKGEMFVWRPVPPTGYLALGYVVTTTDTPPGSDLPLRCVEGKTCVKGFAIEPEPIWKDTGAMWRVPSTGTMVYTEGTDKPKVSVPVPLQAVLLRDAWIDAGNTMKNADDITAWNKLVQFAKAPHDYDNPNPNLTLALTHDQPPML